MLKDGSHGSGLIFGLQGVAVCGKVDGSGGSTDDNGDGTGADDIGDDGGERGCDVKVEQKLLRMDSWTEKVKREEK